MRVLFFNEGNLGSYILGQSQLDEALRAGLSAAPEVQARFVELAPMGRWARAAAMRSAPWLARQNLDFRALRFHMVQSLRARAQVRRELQRWPADVLLLHTQAVAMTMAAVMRTLPVVLSLDSTVYSWSAMPAWPLRQSYAELMLEPSRVLERRALRGAALVLAFTDWARRSVEDEAPGARVITHHPGIDLQRYRPAARRARELPRVLFVGGRFAPKGGEDLLEALGDGLGSEMELDVVTPTELPARPGMRVHRLSQSDPQLLDLQQQADVLCLPTYGDTNPWVLLEAMACGTPVISTPVGGISDMFEGGRAGVLVPYGDPRSLGEAVRALLADPDRRAELAGRARTRCEQHYDARLQFTKLAERMALLTDDQAGVWRRSSTRRSSTPSARSANRSAG